MSRVPRCWNDLKGRKKTVENCVHYTGRGRPPATENGRKQAVFYSLTRLSARSPAAGATRPGWMNGAKSVQGRGLADWDAAADEIVKTMTIQERASASSTISMTNWG